VISGSSGLKRSVALHITGSEAGVSERGNRSGAVSAGRMGHKGIWRGRRQARDGGGVIESDARLVCSAARDERGFFEELFCVG